MDIKIENKDIAITSNGDVITLSGIDEIVQRIKIACTVKKGSFIYDRSLGVDDTDLTSDDMLKQRLEMVFNEACVDIPYTTLRVVSIDCTDTAVTATLHITYGTQSATAEVTVNGQLQ